MSDASDRAQLVRLRQLLESHFNEGELRTLCFDLGIDYESLPGSGKADRARELIAHLERRGRIPDLIVIGKRLRKDVHWPTEPEPDKGTRQAKTHEIVQTLELLKERPEEPVAILPTLPIFPNVGRVIVHYVKPRPLFPQPVPSWQLLPPGFHAWIPDYMRSDLTSEQKMDLIHRGYVQYRHSWPPETPLYLIAESLIEVNVALGVSVDEIECRKSWP